MIDFVHHKDNQSSKESGHGKEAHEMEKSINTIKINETEVGDHLNRLVRQSMEDMINSLLDAVADAICNTGWYQCSADRLDIRVGSYKRKLMTTSGEVDLTVPLLRTLSCETRIIR